MSSTEWHSGSFPNRASNSPPPPRNNDQQGGETRSSLIDNLPNLRSAGTQGVLETIVKGRKSWKTLRGGEVVWPPELEAALLEGLESYQPDDSRETRLLGRFPLRNKFISDFIFHKTGKRRSAKQVGSRLQQLRDTCGGKQLHSLLSPCRKPGFRPSNHLYRSSGLDSDSSGHSSPNSPISPTSGDLTLPGLWSQKRMSPSVMYIDILPEDGLNLSSTRTPPASPLVDDDTTTRISSEPRLMRCIDPTVTFLSKSPISATSSFVVSSDNGVQLHSESLPLVPHTVEVAGSYLYKTAFVPSYWSTIVQCPDPTRFRIHQTVHLADQTILYSTIYKFRYHTPSYSPQLASSSPPHSYSFTNSTDVTDADMNIICDTDYVKSESYYSFGPYQAGWNTGSYTPRSDSTNHSTGYRAASFDDYDSSRSNSLSPTSACFPSELSNYVS